jgi:putative FmdB family regulatory protein
MPVYVYKCRTCKQTFEKRHGMFFEQTRCELCSSEDIFKVPSITVQKPQVNKGKKAGKIVDQYIKDTKEEIRKEKRKLASEEM